MTSISELPGFDVAEPGVNGRRFLLLHLAVALEDTTPSGLHGTMVLDAATLDAPDNDVMTAFAVLAYAVNAFYDVQRESWTQADTDPQPKLMEASAQIEYALRTLVPDNTAHTVTEYGVRCSAYGKSPWIVATSADRNAMVEAMRKKPETSPFTWELVSRLTTPAAPLTVWEEV